MCNLYNLTKGPQTILDLAAPCATAVAICKAVDVSQLSPPIVRHCSGGVGMAAGGTRLLATAFFEPDPCASSRRRVVRQGRLGEGVDEQ